jgi:hypothetical protein
VSPEGKLECEIWGLGELSPFCPFDSFFITGLVILDEFLHFLSHNFLCEVW